MGSDETFLFDDFFVAPDDPGVEHVIELRGRQVPIRVKRGLTLKDVEEAKTRAVQTRIGKDGSLEVTGINEAVLTVEILVRAIKSWPFTHKNGKQVEVSRENLNAMMADCSEAFQRLVKQLMTSNREALTPFEKPSVEG